MPRSDRWQSLSDEVLFLRGHFLPFTFRPLGDYPGRTRTQEYTRAFLVLSHAEIESYLEGWAKEISGACEKKWSDSGKVTTPLAFLLSTYGQQLAIPSTTGDFRGMQMPDRLDASIKRAFKTYNEHITDNNGVKESNVLGLFTPLGVPNDAFSKTLLPNLSSFGKLRGLHVHNSRKAVRDVLDPETEFNRVTQLLEDLDSFDKWLGRCRSGVG